MSLAPHLYPPMNSHINLPLQKANKEIIILLIIFPSSNEMCTGSHELTD